MDHDSVTIDVAGASDANGNAQQDYAPEFEFAIDTLNPTVTSVVASDTLITDADTGAVVENHTFTVTVNFSEAMDQEIDPILTFDPDVASTLSFMSDTWTDTDTYEAIYNVVAADADVNEPKVTIDVEGAEDANGNAQEDYTPLDEFSIAIGVQAPLELAG